MPKPKTAETALKGQIKHMLSLYGFFHYHNLAGLGSYPGVPDITAISPSGEVVQIEAKGPRAKWRDNQKDFADLWRKRGGTYLLVKDIDELIDWLKGRGYMR